MNPYFYEVRNFIKVWRAFFAHNSRKYALNIMKWMKQGENKE